eukprot:5094646-Pyramimonas_sp.AAC.1
MASIGHRWLIRVPIWLLRYLRRLRGTSGPRAPLAVWGPHQALRGHEGASRGLGASRYPYFSSSGTDGGQGRR